MACSIVACCMNKVDLKNEGMEYIIGNNDVINDVLNVVNFLTDRLETKLPLTHFSCTVIGIFLVFLLSWPTSIGLGL